MRLPLRPFMLLLPLVLAGAPPVAPDRPFPLAPYRNLGAPWLASRSDAALLSRPFQTRKAAEFQKLYLGPWDPEFVGAHCTPEMAGLEARALADLARNLGAGTGLGADLRPYPPGWLDRLREQLPAQGDAGPFRPERCAIITENALVRLLPTRDLFIQPPDQPGQGFAFDNLQYSVLWAGTPVYLLEQTRDQAWCKVLGADCAGWVQSRSLALAGADFIQHWRQAVQQDGLEAVIASATPVLDFAGHYRGAAYIGSVFPRRRDAGRRPAILVPWRHPVTRQASCVPAFLAEGAGAALPWPYTPRNAARLWQTLLGRPYGWGNAQFNNDCSAELKHFFTPFGLWLPRYSSAQKAAGHTIDLSGLDLQGRLATLARIGRPYRSLLWFQGHVMLYLGPLPGDTRGGFMTYQNLWGLKPRSGPDFRAIVGAAVLFPVLAQYPEAPELQSLADKGQFVVSQLDEDP